MTSPARGTGPRARCYGSASARAFAGVAGLSDVFSLVVRPNPVLAPRHVYEARAERWQRQWPSLTVLPWPGP